MLRPSRSGPSPRSRMPAAIPARPISRSRSLARTGRWPRRTMPNWSSCPPSPAGLNNCGVSTSLPTAVGASCLRLYRIPKRRWLCLLSAAVSRRFPSSIARVRNTVGCSRRNEQDCKAPHTGAGYFRGGLFRIGRDCANLRAHPDQPRLKGKSARRRWLHPALADPGADPRQRAHRQRGPSGRQKRVLCQPVHRHSARRR